MLDDRQVDTEVTAGAGHPPLDFTVRMSTRARRVRLTVSARDGLVVIVPVAWRGDPAAIVASRHAWAERALGSVAEKRARLLAGAEALLPDEVTLAAIGVRLPVEYRETGARGVSVREQGPLLVATGPVHDADACLDALRRWLARRAREELPRLVEDEAGRVGLHPAAIRVTAARTRWGSCSARGTVSMNRNALFLPEHLARALVLHELAHLAVLDHSARFWSLLATLDAHALEHRAQLKRAGDFVPLWADA